MRKGRLHQAFMLSIILVFSISMLLAGCTKNTENNGNNGKTDTSESVPKESPVKEEPSVAPEPPMEISVLSVNPPKDDDSFVQKYLEERYNVKFTNIRVNRDTWAEQLNIKLAAKEIPDIWYLWGFGEVQQYRQQGLLASIPRNLVEEVMTDYTAQIKDMNAEGAWRPAQYEDKYYAIPSLWLDGATSYLTGYNKAWLDKLGFSGPPTNLEEFEQWLIKARNDDPDGNNKKDTYGYSTTGKYTYQAFNTIFAAFHVMPNMWVEDDDGMLKIGMITEKGREGLKQINKWYAQGLIDPEFITTDGEKFNKDTADGRIGISEDYWYYFDPYEGNIQKMFMEANPGNELVIGKPLAGPYGPGTALSFGPFTGYVGMGIQLQDQPEKMKKILEIWHDMTTDKELYQLVTFGKEGESYKLTDGRVEKIGDYQQQEVLGADLGAGQFYNPFAGSITAFQDFTMTSDRLAFKDQVTKDVPTMYWKKLFSVPADNEFPDLAKMQDEYLIKFVTGEVDLDKGFDDFVAKWKAAGGEKILKETDEYYKANFK